MVKAQNERGGESMYQQSNRERCEILAEYLIERACTVRAVARVFSVSKSTVHKDITAKLMTVNPDLYDRVKKVLDLNKSQRHLRGGEATRIKYLRKRRERTV